ncbi:hypothetical protein MAR_021129, partial [Mya arenaria]
MSLEKQRTTWDEKERLCAVRLVIEQYDVLYGGFADGITFKEKSAAWIKVADDLNASSNVKRTPAEVKKLFQNYKESIILLAKKKYNENMATGGGPVGKITLAEEIVLEFLKDKPQLIGIPGGIESGVIEPVEDAASVADLVVQQAPMTESKHISTHQETVSVHAIEHPSVSHEHPDEPRVMQTNTKKRRRKCMDGIELTEELHDLEVCRARKEIELLDLKIAQQLGYSMKSLHLTSRSFDPDSFHSELMLLAAQIQRLLSKLDAVKSSELSTCIRPLLSDGELDMEFIILTPFL